LIHLRLPAKPELFKSITPKTGDQSYKAPVGTTLSARQLGSRVFHVCQIVTANETDTAVCVRWLTTGAKEWLPRKQDLFKDLGEERDRKRFLPLNMVAATVSKRPVSKKRKIDFFFEVIPIDDPSLPMKYTEKLKMTLKGNHTLIFQYSVFLIM
jgi:hypothetical protein